MRVKRVRNVKAIQREGPKVSQDVARAQLPVRVLTTDLLKVSTTSCERELLNLLIKESLFMAKRCGRYVCKDCVLSFDRITF